MKHLEQCMEELLGKGSAQNLIVKIGEGHETLCEYYLTSEDRELNGETLFDLESLTKIVCTAPLAMIAMDKGLLSPTDTVGKFFDCEIPEDRQGMTVEHLLTHTSGHRNRSIFRAKGTKYDVWRYLASECSMQFPVGTDLALSCRGYILLGCILERVFGCPLQIAFDRYIAKPLGMAHTEFIPDDRSNLIPSIDDPTLLGSPLDANARLLGGVAGNCGLFGCLNDLTKYADMLLSEGAPLMSREIFLQGRSVRTPGMREARGYGFLFIDETYPHTGALFPAGSFGHVAFTGQSLFVDPASGRYVIVLSDSALATERKYGHVISSEVVALRRSIHEAILADLSE